VLANKTPTILVVDDEKSIREIIQLHLESQGFEVFTADGGKNAIDIASKLDINIDILITDIIMPHMNGKDLANRICAIKPFIKVLFVSAYSAELLFSNNMCPEGCDIIRKPFTKETLLNRIAQVWTSSPKWKELVSK
jgi:two-component system cell cycle sensor histidine kinase/response regulator CckA